MEGAFGFSKNRKRELRPHPKTGLDKGRMSDANTGSYLWKEMQGTWSCLECQGEKGHSNAILMSRLEVIYG